MLNNVVQPAVVKRPNIVTLADVAAAASADPDLTANRKKQLRWAIEVVCRAMKTPAASCKAEPGPLARFLDGVTAAQLGVNHQTFLSARSGFRFALRRVGVLKSKSPSRVPLAPAWTDLLSAITDKGDRIGLSRLARYCSEHGTNPDDVGDGTFSDLLREMEHGEIVRNPRRAHRRAAMLWNKHVNKTRNWPSSPVQVPVYSRTYALPWTSFPPTLLEDLEAHLAHLSGVTPGSRLEVRPLKPSSIKARRHQVHIFITGAVKRGIHPDTLKTLADVVTVHVVKEGLTFLAERSEGRDNGFAQAHDVSRTLTSIARHWVRVPAEHLAQMCSMTKALGNSPLGMSKTNKTRLRQFDDPSNLAKLLNLPSALLKKAQSCEGRPKRAEAILVQQALGVELLVMNPIRLHNLSAIDFKKHIIRQGDGRVFLFFDGDETKNGVEVDSELPSCTIKLMDLYLRVYHPLLCSVPTTALFPGPNGAPKTRSLFGKQLREMIKKQTGLDVHVHLFRHICIKNLLDEHPGSYALAQRLLGHRSLQTTMMIYSGLERRSAVKFYDKIILARRGVDEPGKDV